MPSLLEYLLVSQGRPHVQRYSRQSDNQWLVADVDGLEQSVQLASIGCVLPLAEVYDKVEF